MNGTALILVAAGMLTLLYGLWLAWPPLAPIAAGVWLLAVAEYIRRKEAD